MADACIDIGTNTTRLLVAECAGGRLEEIAAERAFTRLGRGLRPGGELRAERIAQTADVVAAQVRAARGLGARRLRVVATAAVRDAANAAACAAAISERAGVAVDVLSAEEEARLSFAGATRELPRAVASPVAVVDVGGGSTEIAVGTLAAGASWYVSLAIGSGLLGDAYLRGDPPVRADLEAARRHARAVFAGVTVPRATHALAVGGSATSLRRLVGEALTPSALDRALETLGAAPADELAERFDLDPERAQLLPAGVLILAELTALLGSPLEVGAGGLREGVLLELERTP